MHQSKVLVVDDEPDVREVFFRQLVNFGYEPLSVGSAEDALRIIKSGPVQLILLDIVLPGIGGVDLCRAIQGCAIIARTPVVLMSGELPGDVMRAVEERFGVAVYEKNELIRNLSAVISGLLHPPHGGRRRSCHHRLSIDRSREVINIDGQPLTGLPHQAYRLLCALVGHDGPIKREALLELLRPGGDNISLVDVSIHRLRKRLLRFPYIHIDATGNGYKLVVT